MERAKLSPEREMYTMKIRLAVLVLLGMAFVAGYQRRAEAAVFGCQRTNNGCLDNGCLEQGGLCEVQRGGLCLCVF